MTNPFDPRTFLLRRISSFLVGNLDHYDPDSFDAELRRDFPEYFTGGEGVALFEGLFHLLRVNLAFTRESEDVAEIGWQCAPIRDGIIADTPATDAEMDSVTARALTFWTAIQGFYPATMALDRIVYHDCGPTVTDELGHLRGITYDDAGHRVPGQAPKNPALRTDSQTGLVGTSDAVRFLPPQVAMDVTLKTARRREWGRFYLPAPDQNTLTIGDTHALGIGQIDHDVVVAVRDAAGALLEGLSDDGVQMVVWSTKHQFALSVDQVQVDSLYDVIRSRRYDRPRERQTHTLGA